MRGRWSTACWSNEGRPLGWAHAAAEEAIASSDFSGVVAVDIGDNRFFQATSGHAHRASAIPNSLDTRFAITSGSKAFTALAVMRLVDEGLIDLDAPIRTWLLHLPVRGNGDGGAFTTVDDLHRFWRALFNEEILPVEAVHRLVQSVSDVPEENMRYGMGFWLERVGNAVVMEGSSA